MEKLNDFILEERVRRNISGVKIKYHLKRLKTYLDKKAIQETALSPSQAQGFQKFLLEAGYTKGTVLNFLKTALRYYEYLRQTGKVYQNPFKLVKKVKEEKRLPLNLLKEKEMEGLLNDLTHFNDEKDFFEQLRKYRVHVLSEILYSTGFRIGEAAGIKEENIDLENGKVLIYGEKGSGRREGFLNETAKGVLKHYLEEIFPLLKSEKSLLFGSSPRRVVTIFNREIKKACLKLQLPPQTSHSFRHTFGYHLLRSGCDIRRIQQLLGHKRLKNTEIYTKVDKEELREALDKYHPRKWRLKDA